MPSNHGYCDKLDTASDSASTLSTWDEDFSIEGDERHIQLGLQSLPLELLQDHIAPFISNRDIKHLRASCVQLATKLFPCLRFPRLFISASRKNIEVFNAICAHPIFRDKVEEIVWDATLLKMPKSVDWIAVGQLAGGHDVGLDQSAADLEKKLIAEGHWTAYSSACECAFLHWPNPPTMIKKVVFPGLGVATVGAFARLDIFDENVRRIRSSKRWRQLSVPAPQIVEEIIPPPSTWRGLAANTAYLVRYTELYGSSSDPPFTLRLSQAYFETLIREQEEIVKSEADIKAFLAGITSLPNLKRIRITKNTYSPDYLWSPYPTPLIRGFPYGFRMPHLPQARSSSNFSELKPEAYMFGSSRALFAIIQGLRATPSLLAKLEALIIECDVKHVPEMECPTDKAVRATLNRTRGFPLIIPEPRGYVRLGIRKVNMNSWLRLAFSGSSTPKLFFLAPPPIAALKG